MNQVVLGVNAYHADSAAALVVNGEVVAAAEEERFRRIKHWAGVPTEAIRWCCRHAGIDLDAVDAVAVNSDPWARLPAKAAYTLAHRPNLGFIADKLRNKAQRAGIRLAIDPLSPGGHYKGEIIRVEHHRAHLASAFLCSPFDEATVVSVDGFGDFASASWGIGRGAAMAVEGEVRFPHSLGAFYTALTQFLGFPHYGDEYKVMGLAPYGEPTYLPQMRQLVRLRPDGGYALNLRYFRHAREQLPNKWDDGIPVVGVHWAPVLEQLLGSARRPDEPLEQRHRDIARSAQVMYEEAFFHLLNALHRRHRVDAVTIAGGCGMNSVANGKITERTPYRRVYVQSAAGDAGGAMGAALLAWQQRGGGRPAPMSHAYLGPEYGESEFDRLLQESASRLAAAGCTVRRESHLDQLVGETAAGIAAGEVVGWFQGRLEWGPRALGNRSILGDPRRADMKDILNAKIKRRESFRPFAPSVLREAVPDWFTIEGDVPFMMQVYPIRPEKRATIPAVCHVDGSGRLQTVTAESNPRYHALIRAFAEQTGVPMVLNTSFNENEPVVCRPEEALDCFLRTKMDRLVLGDWVVQRRTALQ